ncbi:MAG TPA: DUF4097 family beta strand repeat-containing protein [Blastocatellia bacterium]|nr:DUF4097 family beta strand repeat-containing protein [Blastocatellia bacterium]
MFRSIYRVALSSLAILAAATIVSAQDFQKSYRVGTGADVRVSTVSGDVKVTGYNGDAIIVTGYKEGRDADMVEIEDRSGGNTVDVRVRYPRECRCDASVRFEVQVPRSTRYNFDSFSSVSGGVEVRSVTGKLRASSVSGTVRVEDVEGIVNASSVSGNVEVDINRLEGPEDMKFSSVSGNVNVRIPSNLDAEIEMSTLSGGLRTDFPIEVREEKYGPGRSARGRVGEGSRRLKMSSVSGSITLNYSGR